MKEDEAIQMVKEHLPDATITIGGERNIMTIQVIMKDGNKLSVDILPPVNGGVDEGMIQAACNNLQLHLRYA